MKKVELFQGIVILSFVSTQRREHNMLTEITYPSMSGLACATKQLHAA